MKFATLGFSLIIFGTLAIVPQPAKACGCFPSIAALKKVSTKKLVRDELKRSNAVFSGKVLSITYDDGALVVKFSVLRTWKHVKAAEVTVRTPPNDSMCGYTFEVGQTYLVYAGSVIEGELWTNHCTRTKNIRDASEDIRALGQGRAPRR